MNEKEVGRAASALEEKSPQEVIDWALKKFGGKIALASSFGAEDVALTDMLVRLKPDAKIFTLDTGRLNEETYEVWDRLEKKYGITITAYHPDGKKIEALLKQKGPYSFRQSVDERRQCCGLRKVEPLRRALSGLDAWITGLRRSQSVTRADIRKIEVDKANGGILKVNPLADWSEKKLWDYIKKNGVPYNRLHDRGYPSIGCEPCTRAVAPGEDVRSGRWWWENPETKECGLHGTCRRK